MDRCRVLLPPFALLLALAGGAFAGGPDAKPIETFTAFAAEAGAGRKAAVRIEVQRWSTEEEHERLLAALRESGPEKLLDALREIRGPVGRIWTPTSLSYDLSYARSNPAPGGGRRVILAADRPVSFLEMRNPSRRIRSNSRSSRSISTGTGRVRASSFPPPE